MLVFIENKEGCLMTADELAQKIDQTLLRPDVTSAQMSRFLADAIIYPFASVCIPPCFVLQAAAALSPSPVKVCTVAGFPLGYQLAASKVKEAANAFEDGAVEIDMVMNIAALKSGETARVEDEIAQVVSAVPEAVIKVIIETCYLNREEKVAACDAVIRGGADFVKTSTGFGPAGASVEDISLLSEHAAGRVRIKASGGIGTTDAALDMLDAGADRIGTSRGVEIIKGLSG